MEQLKPCPFCGGEAKIMKMGYPHWVYCLQCGAKVHGGTTSEKDSIKAWNRRTEPKHGKWEMKPDPYGYFDLIPVCTACGCTTKWREKYSFCPNCGADMRERIEE